MGAEGGGRSRQAPPRRLGGPWWPSPLQSPAADDFGLGRLAHVDILKRLTLQPARTWLPFLWTSVDRSLGGPQLRTRILESQGEEICRTDHQEIHELLYTVSQSCNPYICIPCSIQLQSTCNLGPSLTLSYCHHCCGPSSMGCNTCIIFKLWLV